MSDTPSNDPPQPSPPDRPLDVMSCEQAGRQIERMIEDNELKEIERTLLFTHVRACAQCKAELQRRRALEVKLKEVFSAIDTSADFNARLMAALPELEFNVKTEPASALGSTTARLQRVSVHAISAAPRLFRRWRIPLGVAAMVCVGLAGMLLRTSLMTTRNSDRLPWVFRDAGRAVIRQSSGAQDALVNDHIMSSNEVIAAVNDEAKIRLQFADQLLAQVTLQPGAELSASNRHSYALTGSAHFDVNHDRPHEPDEDFEVNLASGAVVRVKGTRFDIKNAGGNAVVSVESGHVQVQGKTTVELRDGEQVTLGPGGYISPKAVCALPQTGRPGIHSLPPDAMPELHPADRETAPVVSPPGFEKMPIINPDQLDAGRTFDWNAHVGPLEIADLPLADGIDELARHFGNPKSLTELAQRARSPLIPPENRLSFSIHHAMKVRSALAWMARDVGARFEVGEDGRGQLRRAAPDELPGNVESGAIPENIQKLLEAPERADRTGRFVGARSLSLASALDEAAAACGVTMIADRDAAPADENVEALSPEPGSRMTAARRLDALLARAHLCAVWYDDALYVSHEQKLEALTTEARSSNPVSLLTGIPEQAEWSRSLLSILENYHAMPARLPRSQPGMPPCADLPSYTELDAALAGRPAYSNVAIAQSNDTGPFIRYRAGIFGCNWMTVLLKQLERGSGPAPGASRLTQVPPPGPLKDINALIELSRNIMPVESNIKNPAFNHQAFYVKNLPLGRTLEWGAWLQGAGLRNGPNGMIIDSSEACYGPPSLQVIVLSDKSPELANALPATLARLLPELYPTFFGGVELRALAGRIAFVGDRRQLQLASEVAAALDQELETGDAERKKIDLAAWRPASRRALDKNLAEPFKDTEGAGVVSGPFAGLLRQSSFGLQFRHTVIVDLAGMQAHCNDPINAMDVSEITVGQFIDRLAKQVGMKAVIEGDVVWIRP